MFFYSLSDYDIVAFYYLFLLIDDQLVISLSIFSYSFIFYYPLRVSILINFFLFFCEKVRYNERRF